MSKEEFAMLAEINTLNGITLLLLLNLGHEGVFTRNNNEIIGSYAGQQGYR